MDPLIVCNEECVFITDVVAGYNATEIKKKLSNSTLVKNK